MSDDNLNQRFRDIDANSLTLTAEGRIGMRSMEEGGEFWVRRLTDVLEELRLRDRDHRSVGRGPMHLPTPSVQHGAPGADAFARLVLREGDFLVKYGRRARLEALTERGELRVAPASSYDDPSLDPARADSELSLDLDLHPRHFDELYPDLGQHIQPVTNVAVRWGTDTDYYVACFAQTVDYRLFGDFEADAAVIIHDVPRFITAVRDAFRRAVGDWIDVATSVQYVDPVSPGGSNVNVFVSKHFRYAYQREFRFVWKPTNRVDEIEPVMLSLDLKEAGVRTEMISAFGAEAST